MGNIWKRIVAQLNKPLFAGPPPRRMPATPFGEIRDGAFVGVVGRALPDGEPWRTPLGGIEAACWSWNVRQFSTEDSRHGRWDLLEDIEFGAVFWLEGDEGQRVRVERQGVSVIARRPLTLCGKPSARMRANIDAFLQSHAIEMHDHFYGFDRSHMYSEWVVPVGARVTVAGVAQLMPDAEGITTDGYRGAPHRVTLIPPASGALGIAIEE